MSTFDGIIREYPLISIDRFMERRNYASTIYFLSHCHTDHMYGLSDDNFFYLLQSRGFSKIYMSDVSYHLLKNNERYQHLSDYIVQLPLEAPTLIDVYDTEGREVLKVTVTLLTAGHCPGSVMFFIEGENGNVLYTGDFRLPIGSAARLTHLHETKEKVKPLKSLYIDTTFCKEKNLFIPSREECLNKILAIVEPWLSESPNHIVYILCPYELAYEFVFVELWKRFGLKTHVKDELEKKYKGIKSLEDAITSCASGARIHACLIDKDNKLAGYIKNSYRHETPCGFTSSDGKTVHVLKIKPSAMFFTKNEFSSISDENKRNNFHRVYYSTHPSLSEIQDMVYYLKPSRVFPNVVKNQTKEEILDLIFLHYQAKTAESDKENSDISSLGKLKSPSVQDTPSEEDFSLPFFDQDYALKPIKKKVINSSVKSHESKGNISIDTDFDNTEEQETMLREEIYSVSSEAGNCKGINNSPLKWQNPIESSDEELFVSCDGISDENPDKGGSDVIFGTPEEEHVIHFGEEEERSSIALSNECVRSSASESLIDEQYVNYLCDMKYSNKWTMSQRMEIQIDMEYSKICETDNGYNRGKIEVEKDKNQHLINNCNVFEQKKEISVVDTCVVSNSSVNHFQSEYSIKTNQQFKENKMKTINNKKEENTNIYKISQYNEKSNSSKNSISKSSSYSEFECSNLPKADNKIKSNDNKIENCKTGNSKNVNFSKMKNPKITESNSITKCALELQKNKIGDFNTFCDFPNQSKEFRMINSTSNYGSNKVFSNNNDAYHSKLGSSKETEKVSVMKIDAKSFNVVAAESNIKNNPNSFTFISGKNEHYSGSDKVNLNKTDFETTVSHAQDIQDTLLEQEDKKMNKKLVYVSHKTSNDLLKSNINETPGPHVKNRHKKTKSFHFVKKINSSSSESEDEYTFKHVIKIPEKNKTNSLNELKSFNPIDHKYNSFNNSFEQRQENQLKSNLLIKNNCEMKSTSATKFVSLENSNFRNNKQSSEITTEKSTSDFNKKLEKNSASVSNQDSLVERINFSLPSNSLYHTCKQKNDALNLKSLSELSVCKASCNDKIHTNEKNAEIVQQNSLNVKEFKNEHVRDLYKLSDHINHEVDVITLEDTKENSEKKSSFLDKEVQTEVVSKSKYKEQESEVSYDIVNSDIFHRSNKHNFSFNTISKIDPCDTNDKNNSRNVLYDSTRKESIIQLSNAQIEFNNPNKFPEMRSDNEINNEIDCIPDSPQNETFENKVTQDNKSASQSSSDSSVIIEEIIPSNTVILGNEYHPNNKLSLYQNGIHKSNTTAWEIKSVSQSGSNVIVEEVYSSSDIDDSPSLIAPIVPKSTLNDVSSSLNSFTVSKRRRIDFGEVGPSNRTEGCDKVCDNNIIESDSTPELLENMCTHRDIAVEKSILEITIDDDW